MDYQIFKQCTINTNLTVASMARGRLLTEGGGGLIRTNPTGTNLRPQGRRRGRFGGGGSEGCTKEEEEESYIQNFYKYMF